MSMPDDNRRGGFSGLCDVAVRMPKLRNIPRSAKTDNNSYHTRICDSVVDELVIVHSVRMGYDTYTPSSCDHPTRRVLLQLSVSADGPTDGQDAFYGSVC